MIRGYEHIVEIYKSTLALLMVVLMFTPTQVHSQVLPEKDSSEYYPLFDKALEAYETHDIPMAAALVDSVLEVYSRTFGNDHPHLIKCLELKVMVRIALHEYEEALPEARRALELGSKYLKSDDPRIGLIYKNLAIIETEDKAYEKAKKHLQNADHALRNDSVLYAQHEGTLMMEMGILQRRLKNFENAVNYYLLALEAYEREGNMEGLAKTNHNLANTYYDLFENALARFHYKEAIRLYSADMVFGKALAHEGVALTYRQERVYDLAIKNLFLSLDYVRQSYGSKHYYYDRILRKIAGNYTRMEEYDKAVELLNGILDITSQPRIVEQLARGYIGLEQYDDAYELLNRTLVQKDADVMDSLYTLPYYADVLLHRSDTQSAFQCLKANLNQRISLYPKTNSRIQEGYGNLIEMAYSGGLYDQALSGLDTLLVSPNNMTVLLPNGRALRTSLWDDLMQLKCKVLFARYKQDPSEEKRDQIIETSTKYLQSFDTIRQYSASVGSQMKINGRPTEVIEILLDLLYEQYVETGNEAIIERALLDMDLVRDMLWIDIVQNRQAADLSPTQLSEIKKQNEIRKEMASLELRVRFNPDSASIRNRLLELSEELQKSKMIAGESISMNSSIKEGEVISQLRENAGLSISYFVTDDYMYRIIVSEGSADFERIPWSSELEQDVLLFVDGIANSGELSGELHEKLSHILFGGIPPIKSDGIIIYPDGVLYLLPFEIIIEEETGRYLLEDHDISYSSSLKRTFFEYSDMDYTYELTAFAPSYREWAQSEVRPVIISTDTLVRQDIVPLPGALDEVRRICSITKGEVFDNQNATISNFYNRSGVSRILHLSMHALVEAKQPSLSRLVFTPTDTNDLNSAYCYAGELAAREIPAELVVLSACNTGIGEFVRGEGVQSLARSFEYAGAQSILHSLWKIPDAATRELMESFYLELDKGLDKSRALQQAKLNFKEKYRNSDLAHPYYWAGFVLSGKPGPLSNKNKFVSMRFLPWILVVLAALIFFGIKRTRRQP